MLVVAYMRLIYSILIKCRQLNPLTYLRNKTLKKQQITTPFIRTQTLLLSRWTTYLSGGALKMYEWNYPHDPAGMENLEAAGRWQTSNILQNHKNYKTIIAYTELYLSKSRYSQNCLSKHQRNALSLLTLLDPGCLRQVSVLHWPIKFYWHLYYSTEYWCVFTWYVSKNFLLCFKYDSVLKSVFLLQIWGC